MVSSLKREVGCQAVAKQRKSLQPWIEDWVIVPATPSRQDSQKDLQVAVRECQGVSPP